MRRDFLQGAICVAQMQESEKRASAEGYSEA